MIAVPCLRENEGPFNILFQRLTRHAVVNSPTFVVVPGIGSVAPPGVIVRLFVEVPEGVVKTALDEVSDPLSFNRQEARGVFVLDRVVNVNGFVADVVVPTDKQVRDLLFQIIDVFLEFSHVIEFEIQAGIIGALRQVETHDR